MPSIRNNRVIDEKYVPLDKRERAMRKLQNPRTTSIEVLSGGDALSVSDFVMNLNESWSTKEYFCSVCGAHVLIHGVKIEGLVRCRCRRMLEGTPL